MKELEDIEMLGARVPDMERIDPSPLFRVMLVNVVLSAIERYARLSASSINGDELNLKSEMSDATKQRVPLQRKREELNSEVEVLL